jgi:hypothetical protein|tara:strand:- start:274 stop:1392 length:1119 start_codon:yes stop_codon:yes gene_type:complete
MSTLKVDGIRSNSASSDAITLAADGTCTASVTNNLSNRRMNINGGMQVWQRGTSVSVSDGSNENFQTVDRYGFKFGNASAGAATVSQSTDVPTNLGFPYSYKLDVTTANNNSANNTQINFYYRFEAQDIVNSGWKYNDSSSFLTISFYFKSNKTGTNKLPIMVQTSDGTSYVYVSEITQSDTNWNRHTIKVPGNSNLTFDNNNGQGLEIAWYFTVGSSLQGAADTWGTSVIHGTSNSTNYFDSTSNDMFITGIQVEATTNGIATDFEHRSFADELRACQRYFQNYITYAEYTSGGTGNLGMPITTLVTPMRTSPTFIVNNESKSSNWAFHSFNFSQPPNSDARGYSYFQILIQTSDSNYGYLRRYGNCAAEL